MSDASYPTMGFYINVHMEERTTGGWRWYVQVHIIGPDDILSKKSEVFATKEECLKDMLLNTVTRIDEVIESF